MKKNYLLNADETNIGFLIKLFRIMKISVFLLFICIFQIFADDSYSQTTRLTLSMDDATVEQVLEEIEAQSEFYILYNHQLVDVSQRVDIEVSNKKINNILTALFKNTDVEHLVLGRQIILSPKYILYEAVAKNQGTQEGIEIRGTIVDENGDPLPGVNIVVKGTAIGTITNMDGSYMIDVPNENTTLAFSSVGFVTQEIIVGNQTVIDIKLIPDIVALDEVVVTALGFERMFDKVGVGSSKIDDEQLENSIQPTLLSSMAGKVSGLQIVKSSGDPGASSYIQIRGQSTITGGFQPLVILDGIPVSGSPNRRETGDGVMQQSRLNDINSTDIESIQVLKGASAAALWGSRAANGVILITTKSGKKSEHTKVSFISTYSFDKANMTHPYQTIFGQGDAGAFVENFARSWGDKISDRSGGADELDKSGRYFISESGNEYYPIINKNSREVFANSNKDAVFGTGHFFENVLTLSDGNDRSTYYVSLGDMNQKGFMDKSNYRRSTIRLNVTFAINKYISFKVNSSYIRTSSDRIQYGSNLSGIGLALYRNPPDFDIRDYKGTYYSSAISAGSPDAHRAYRNSLGSSSPVYSNPLWVINELENTQKINRGILSAELNFHPLEWLDLIARGGTDYFADGVTTYYPVNTRISGSGSPGRTGYYSESLQNYTQTNLDLMGRLSKEFSSEFALEFLTGFNLNQRKGETIGGSMKNFIEPDGPKNFSNALPEDKTPSNWISKVRNSRGYATLTIDLFNSLFINASAAAETASTFGELSDDLFYYPSADIAWNFSALDIFQDSKILSFGKVRAAYGAVGVEPSAYRTSSYFHTGGVSGFNQNLDGSFYGDGAKRLGGSRGSSDLRPERKTEWETGLDLRFLKNKLKTSFTYYQNTIDDLLLSISVPASTGFTGQYTNVGSMENKGFEIDLNYRLIAAKDFTMELFVNAASNTNLVTDLGGNSTVFLGGSGLSSVVAKEGEPLGVIYDGGYLRNDDASLNLRDDGFPQLSPELQVIGDPNPDWTGGFGTILSYKGLFLNILFETSQGGDFFQGTKSVMNQFGTHAETGNEVTLSQDLNNYGGDLIPSGTTVRGNVKDFGGGPVLLDESWYEGLGGGFNGLVEPYVTDGSWTRLREVSLGYILNSPWLRDRTKLESVQFNISANNLLLWTGVEGIDPETNLNGVRLARGIDYFNSPGVKSFSFSIKINY